MGGLSNKTAVFCRPDDLLAWLAVALLVLGPLFSGCGRSPAEAVAWEFFHALRRQDTETALRLYRPTPSSAAVRPPDRVPADLQTTASLLSRLEIRDLRVAQRSFRRATPADRARGDGDTYWIGLEFAVRLGRDLWQPRLFTVGVQDVNGQWAVTDWR